MTACTEISDVPPVGASGVDAVIVGWYIGAPIVDIENATSPVASVVAVVVEDM